MSLSRQDFFAIISKHLEHPKGVIVIEQNGYKLKKEGEKNNKYNWSLNDILKVASNVEDFIDQLPNKGFTNGATLNFGVLEGNQNRYRHQRDTTLHFPDTLNTENTTQNTQKMQTNTPQQMAAPQQQNAVVNGSPHVYVPQFEYLNLKVKEHRFDELEYQHKKAYSDLEERYKEVKKQAEKAESDLRKEQEKTNALDQKLAIIYDKHEHELQKAKDSAKGFLDTETGQSLAGSLGAALPNIFDALGRIGSKQTASVGMGVPVENLRPLQQQLLNEVKQYPDLALQILSQTGKALIDVDGFAEELQKTLAHINSNNQTNE